MPTERKLARRRATSVAAIAGLLSLQPRVAAADEILSRNDAMLVGGVLLVGAATAVATVRNGVAAARDEQVGKGWVAVGAVGGSATLLLGGYTLGVAATDKTGERSVLPGLFILALGATSIALAAAGAKERDSAPTGTTSAGLDVKPATLVWATPTIRF